MFKYIFGFKPDKVTELVRGNRFVWVVYGQKFEAKITGYPTPRGIAIATLDKRGEVGHTMVMFDRYFQRSGDILWNEMDYLRYHDLIERTLDFVKHLLIALAASWFARGKNKK